ncbi:putative RNA-binding protein YhgF [uncultured Gammaproteobacteria bacterium]
MTNALSALTAGISRRIAGELAVRPQQVEATVQLLDEGSTVPFIARYRKEATGGLDDTQLRRLEERLLYLRELEDRRGAILKSIAEQGKLSEVLAGQINAAETKTDLEDLYLPYKQKRRTKALIAREAGLEPLADLLLGDPTRTPLSEAEAFVNADKGVADAKAALDGARHILVERFGETAELVKRLRTLFAEQGRVVSKLIEDKRAEGAKFSDYFDSSEPFGQVPSHRALAMFRGRAQGVLDLKLEVGEPDQTPHPCEAIIARTTGIVDAGRPADRWLLDTCRWTWKLKIGPHIETDLMSELRERAEDEAMRVFSRNLHDLLLAAPAGPRTALGLDPGIRTGVKVAVIDTTGKMVETATIYPHEPRKDWQGSLAVLAALALRHKVDLVAIGNGTASRETDKLVADLIALHPQLNLTKVMVSEAGASVYSASELAAAEFPGLDVTLRGAVSIARRLQDPLAELVKIDPKSIGVGQYQHDVEPRKMARALDAVVEDCVNAVGVDLNTASVPLLTRVSGLNETVARNIVEYRDKNGAFLNRRQLMEVPRLGAKTFEQAAGFLRILNGDTPLDASSVHPEAYPVVERIQAQLKRELKSLIGDAKVLRTLDPAEFTDERFGVPTVTDILRELEKPGRDPRPEFKTAEFKDGVEQLKDLKPGMVLEGVVTNVTAFGAFVDIGVHQDGLVHISRLADKFVKDPHTVVKPGDVVKVKVLEVDLARKRVSLTMRLEESAAPVAAASVPTPRSEGRPSGPRGPKSGAGQGGGARRPAPAAVVQAPTPPSFGDNALADAFARAKERKGK